MFMFFVTPAGELLVDGGSDLVIARPGRRRRCCRPRTGGRPGWPALVVVAVVSAKLSEHPLPVLRGDGEAMAAGVVAAVLLDGHVDRRFR